MQCHPTKAAPAALRCALRGILAPSRAWGLHSNYPVEKCSFRGDLKHKHTHRETAGCAGLGAVKRAERTNQPASNKRRLGLPPQQTPGKSGAFKPHSRFYSPPGFTLHRFSPHFKGSIFVQTREECKLASCFQSRDINPERAAGLTEEGGRRTRSPGAN